jgi:fructose-bisphosphate aldolase, class I
MKRKSQLILKLNGKTNIPDDDVCPEPYRTLHEPADARLRRVIRSAGRCLVLFSGGTLRARLDAVNKVTECMEAGAAGIIFGRKPLAAVV